ncbi:unnamed protein product [Pedinophyceae sp. YPF-701]|nr:unnamed protein product [Pedinophyceae sp. YPF-701]
MEAFGTSTGEAEMLDPQQRLLMIQAYGLLAGVSSDIALDRAGTYIGIASAEYNGFTARAFGRLGPFNATGGALSVASGRLAYRFGLRGPCMSVDTACSSSLVAAHLAWAAHQSGAVQAALAGGVGLFRSPDSTAMFVKAGMIAADGRCKTLDSRADGYVRAEGCGLTLLVRLHEEPGRNADLAAVAIVRGAAVNQDGRSSSLTAPNGPSQRACIEEAMHSQPDAVLGPSAVGAVHLHGTGTSLGDPIEFGALHHAVAACDSDAPLSIAASKSWLGHGEAASGVLGICFMTQQTGSVAVPPVMHLRSLNEHVQQVCSAGRKLLLPRQAGGLQPATASGIVWGTSAFAFQGTNAHLIAQSVTADAPTLDADWALTRVDLAVPVQPLMGPVSTSRSQITFTVDFSKPRAAATMDFGRAVSLGAFAEVCFNAVSALRHSGGKAPQDHVVRQAVAGELLTFGKGLAATSVELSLSLGDNVLQLNSVDTCSRRRTHFAALASWAPDASSGSLTGSVASLVSPRGALFMSHISASPSNAAHATLNEAGDILATSPRALIDGTAQLVQLVLPASDTLHIRSPTSIDAIAAPADTPSLSSIGPARSNSRATRTSNVSVCQSATGQWSSATSGCFVDGLVVGTQTASDAGALVGARSMLFADALGGASSQAPPGAPSLQRHDVFVAVAQIVDEVVGAHVAVDRPMMDAGLDSLGAVEVHAKLQTELNVDLPQTIVFDYPTVSELAKHLSQMMGQAGGQSVAQVTARRLIGDPRSRSARFVALKGFSRRMQEINVPGTGRDLASRVPQSRWDVEQQIDPPRRGVVVGQQPARALAGQFGVFMPDVHAFDAEAFGISRLEATLMDPQQRLVLAAAHEAFVQRTRASTDVSTSAGIFVGLAANDYEAFCATHRAPKTGYGFTSSAASVASGRVAFCLGLGGGPAMTVDTACSSSLVTTHLAFEAIASGRTPAAISAGVLLVLVPESTAMVQRAGLLSSDGRCKSLDESCDGYARGESCLAVLLEHFDPDARSEPLGLLRGTAVNANTAAQSLMAPHGPSQQLLIQTALAVADATPEDVMALQIHSNGTPIGDSIEVSAVCAQLLQKARPFRFVTQKGFYGHAEAGAGVQSLLEGALGWRTGSHAPLTHLRNLNPLVGSALRGAGTLLPRCHVPAIPLLANSPGQAGMFGVSSFGAQGTNAHALLSTEQTGTTELSRASSAPDSSALWQPKYLSVAPPEVRLLTRAAVSGRAWARRLVYELQPAHTMAARLWDAHYVCGPSLPASALAEFVLSCASSMAAGASVALNDAVVAVPGDARHRLAESDSHSAIHAVIDPATGAVVVGVAGRSATSGALLLQGSLGTQEALIHHVGPSQSHLSLMGVSCGPGGEDVHGSDHALQYLARADSGSAAPPLEACCQALSGAHLEGHSLEGIGLLPRAFASANGASAAPMWVRGVCEAGGSCSGYGAGRNAGAAVLSAVLDIVAMSVHEDPPTDESAALSRLTGLKFEPMVPQLVDDDWSSDSDSDRSSAPAASPAGRAAASGGAVHGGPVPEQIRALAALSSGARRERLVSSVLSEVSNMLGRGVSSEDVLLVSGVDSRAAMEIRQALSGTFGLELPTTLLYDYQTVDQLADYLDATIVQTAAQRPAAAHVSQTDDAARSGPAPRDAPVVSNTAAAPSELLKTLRAEPPTCALFLAAPGVANAQSAYFSFMSYLGWSSQPIMVLDKDDDLTIEELARQNVADILRVQPSGPYLLGGHSYGGVVIMEIAMLLEAAGKEVGQIIIFDSPRPDQVRERNLEHGVTDADVNELIEMILGALGKDALGLGAGIAHPRESAEWKEMTYEQRYEFFAPIWRVMRSQDMSVEEVREQVADVALAVKRASHVSDMRHHTFVRGVTHAPVLYFRGHVRGACDYMNDSRFGDTAHGLCWQDLATSVEVVDVPGDHFALLRQPDADMAIIVNHLKARLAAFGWQETLLPQSHAAQHGAASFGPSDELTAHLRQMGVGEEAIERARKFMAGHAAGGLQGQIGEAAADLFGLEVLCAPTVRALNQQPVTETHVPIFVVHCILGDVAQVLDLADHTRHRMYGLLLPSVDELDRHVDSVALLAQIYASAIRSVHEGPCIMAGIGQGGVVAYEIACTLQDTGTDVQMLTLYEDSVQREVADLMVHPWYVCYPVVRQAGLGLTDEEYLDASGARTATGREQVDRLIDMCPEGTVQDSWTSAIVSAIDRSQRTSGSESSEETQLVRMMLIRMIFEWAEDPNADLNVHGALLELSRMSKFTQFGEWLRQRFPRRRKARIWEQMLSLLKRLSYIRALTESHHPQSLFYGQVVLMHCDYERTMRDFLGGWACGMFSKIATLVLPVHLRPVSAGVCAITKAQRHDDVVAAALRTSRLAEASASDPRRTEDDVPTGPARRWSCWLDINCSLEQLSDSEAKPPVRKAIAPPARQQPGSGARRAIAMRGPAPRCFRNGRLMIAPNVLCAERYTVTAVEESQIAPLARMPLWLFTMGDPRLDYDAACKVASRIPIPTYTVSPADPKDFASFAALVEETSAAMLSKQPSGPFALAGVGPGGCQLAYAVACKLEELTSAVTLVLADGAPSGPKASSGTDLELHTLYESLTSLGALKMRFADFQRSMRGRDVDAVLDFLVKLRPATFKRTDGPTGRATSAAEAWDQHVQGMLMRGRDAEKLPLDGPPTLPRVSGFVFRGSVAALYPRCAGPEAAGILCDIRDRCKGQVRYRRMPWSHGESCRNAEKLRTTSAVIEEAVLAYLTDGNFQSMEPTAQQPHSPDL